jgi:1-acyl-sn-glycerol-3-phosphate acyltransferase
MKQLRAVLILLRLAWHMVLGRREINKHFERYSFEERDQAIQRWARRSLDLMGIRLVLQGQPVAQGPMLVVANHISWLDIMVINAARPCRFVSKADVKEWPLLGPLVVGAGTLFIERESRRDALRVVHIMAERLRAGDVLAAFPEGTTSDGTALLPFHANLLQAAVSANAPIQALAMSFHDEASGQMSQAPTYVGDATLVASLWRTLMSPPIEARLRFGEPQHAQGRDRRAWSGDLRAEIERLLLLNE